MDKTFWRVEMYGIIEREYEESAAEYFLEESAARSQLNELKKEYVMEDGKFLPNYTHIEFSIEKISFEELKEEATLSEIERMFGIELTYDLLVDLKSK